MRLRIQITGLVQGVGFRPFVYRLAEELGLSGYILNSREGVAVEVEGMKSRLDSFLVRLEREKPHISRIYSLHYSFLEEAGFEGFQIRESEGEGEQSAPILPDISICEECAEEIVDPKDRRFMYLFTNCTNCGPRFTIIERLPYDREHTSMKNFAMCHDCSEEYGNASDRRFHAQPNACHACGPMVSLYDNRGELLCSKDDALEKALACIRKGHVLAVKGIGGYHLMCDATNKDAVARLREKKHREEKPVAVMFPDIEMAKNYVHLDELEERAMSSIEKPILIARKKEGSGLTDQVSPGNSTVGVFLPYSPLHLIMLRKLKSPVVATSANISDEPIAKDEKDAFSRLTDITDFFLIHNRGIVRRCDDSVVAIAAGRQMPIRRSRGYAPLPVILPFSLPKTVLALGPYMNNTIALGIGNKVYMSQHIGDLETPLATDFYEGAIDDFLNIFGIEPDVVTADMHPGYYSTKYGMRNYRDRLFMVQHHHAHIMACMAENDVKEGTEVIGFAFDGTGYGDDQTIWGGEVLVASYHGYKRAVHLRPFRLPGGDKSVMEPRRTALSLLYETFGEKAVDYSSIPDKEKLFLLEMIRKGINSPLTTSMGRLFDGVASLLGIRHEVAYHAQAAVLLEQSALRSTDRGTYPFLVKNGLIYQLPVIEGIVDDMNVNVSRDVIARRFHNTVVEIIIASSEMLREETGIRHVALSGGVFQNRIILEGAYDKLKERGFIPLIHQSVPTNDGGVSLGQAVSTIGNLSAKK